MLATLHKNDGTDSTVDVQYAAEVIEHDGDYFVRPFDFIYGMPEPIDYTEASFLRGLNVVSSMQSHP